MKLLSLSLLLLTLAACTPHQPSHTIAKPAASDKSVVAALPTVDQLSNMQPEFLYLAAQKASREGNRELAIRLLTALIDQDSAAIAPHMQLTNLLMQSGRIDEAEQHIAQLLSDKKIEGKPREELQMAQYRIIIARNQPVLALKQLNAFLLQHPSHDTARNMQASVLAGLGRTEDALASITTGIKHEESPTLRLLQAQILIKTGQLKRARISLMRMQKLLPDNSTPVLMLSTLAMQSQHNDEAENLLTTFLSDHPEDIRVSHTLAKLLIDQHRLTEAILIYRKLLSYTGSSAATLRPLGMLYFQDKAYKQAANTFRTLLQLDASDTNRFYLAASMEAIGKKPEAITLYNQIKQASPIAVEAHIRLAALEAQDGKTIQAEKRLTAILKEHPQQLDAHLLLASIRLDNKQYQKMLDETEPLLRLKKLPPQLLFNRAVAFEKFKQYSQIESTLNRLLKHSPNYADALNFLGYTYAEQGIKLNRAGKLILRALRLKPDDGYYLDSLAWVYFKKGDYIKAAAAQKKAVKKITDDSVMQEHYGDILWKNGDPDAARIAWKKALTLTPDHADLIENKIKSGLPSVE
ncbi:MAG: tetratricopeptide repeat protein [Mariprofundus sp.]|nr:tetratricopeptide repeat protein [Mariprofundus sp.]